MAMNEISPRTDFRGTKELRMHMAHVMIKRTIADAVTKAGGVLYQ